MRRAAKVDDNQNKIVEALINFGCVVESLARIGGGCPDLLVGCPENERHGGLIPRRLVLMEVKNPNASPSKRKLTPDQVRWHQDWHGWPVYVVQTPEEAIKIIMEG